MKKRTFRKYAGITIVLLFLAAFVPSALGPAEGTAGSEAAAGPAYAGTAGPASGVMDVTGTGVGTIAMGAAIAEVAMIAVADLQPNSPNSSASY